MTMGVDLYSLNADQEVSFNWTAWRFLLETARYNGWIPAGTILDFEYQYRSFSEGRKLDEDTRERIKREVRKSCAEWSGDYVSNDCQLVNEDDARSILKALVLCINDQLIIQRLNQEQVEIIKKFAEFLKYGPFRIG